VTAAELIARLGLEPHPEGGWYRQTWRGTADDGQRPSGSAIYYLLTDVEVSRRHRVDAAEIWHYYRGAPIELRIGAPGTADEIHLLGPDIEHGQVPQIVVSARDWQEARSLGAFSLVGCTVSPAFEFSGFELADSDGAAT
jgi:predicted cupin superfamily sugar epimerase